MNKAKSIFRRSAEGGVTLGVIFIAIFLLESVVGPLGSLFALALVIYVPVFVYRRLKATYIAAGGELNYSALWLEGIMHFICGSIIFAVGIVVFLRWLVPDYLPMAVDQISQAISTSQLTADPSLTPEQIATLLSSIRPIDVAMTLLWSASFTGCIASAIIAAIVKSKKLNKL